MEIQNPKFNADNSISLDYLHPGFGWIPFTANESEAGLSADLYAIAQETALPYVAPTIVLADRKLERTREVDAARDAGRYDRDAQAITLINGNPVTWQVDPSSIGELNDAITLFSQVGGTPEGFVWRDANNTNHPAPLSVLIEIGLARAAQKQSIWNQSWTLKAQINNATTLAALESITIPEIIQPQ